MKARDVPVIRAQLVDDIAGNRWDIYTADAERLVENGELDRPATKPQAVAALRAAELFFVTAPMERLAREAIATLPDYELHREELPAQCGLLLWETSRPALPNEEKATGYDSIGVLWQDTGTGVRIYEVVDALAYVRQRNPELVGEWAIRYPRFNYSKGHEVTYGDPIWPWGEAPQLTDPSFQAEVTELRSRAALIVVWLLMGQEIVTVGRHVPRSKAAMRRADRLGLPSDVRVVTLRHAAYDPDVIESRLEGAGRVYRHRWYVRGHWRRQWYPSREEHRPIWIPSYIKGPDGAPLLTGSIVRVLAR